MGTQTYLQLRTEAGLLGRDDTRDALLKTKYVRWLRQEASAWPWPVAIERYAALSLPAGSQRIFVGAGLGGNVINRTGTSAAPGEIFSISKPIFVYNSSFGLQRKADITPLNSPDAWKDESSLNPANNRGTPVSFKVRKHPTTEGAWILSPMPVPDQDYLLAFDCRLVPPAPVADGDIPWYPNDETSIAAMRAYLNDLNDGVDQPSVVAALSLVASKVKDDRQRYGTVPGTNDLSMLDPGVFL